MECVACGSREIACMGAMTVFLADNLNGSLGRSMEPGHMYKCNVCTLQFRMPMPGHELLNDYYSNIRSDGAWDSGKDRTEWKYIEKVLADSPVKSILDIGCFRGDFLKFLGNKWERYGVEPSFDASKVAEKRGVKIVGDSLENINLSERDFGAITLIDVIEHLPRPVEALRKLSSGLARGGMLLISTGNTKSLAFRLSGAKYYYGAFPEHVTFYSPRWFEWIAPAIGCSLHSVYKFSHNPAKISRKIDEALKNFVYVAYHRLGQMTAIRQVLPVVPVLKNVALWQNTWWTSAKDHMLVVLTKQS